MNWNAETMLLLAAALGAGGGYLLARRDLRMLEQTVEALRADVERAGGVTRRLEAELVQLRGMLADARDRAPTGNPAVLRRVQEILFAPSEEA
ncbi:MAG: hypothetical protein ACK4YP_03320 [Myxococcota bacterium]